MFIFKIKLYLFSVRNRLVLISGTYEVYRQKCTQFPLKSKYRAARLYRGLAFVRQVFSIRGRNAHIF